MPQHFLVDHFSKLQKKINELKSRWIAIKLSFKMSQRNYRYDVFVESFDSEENIIGILNFALESCSL